MFEDIDAIQRLLAKDIKECKILVIGDVMLDRYYLGEVKRISPEAPVPVTRVLAEKEVLGGAANVVHNLALLGCKVHLAGVTGRDENRLRLSKLLAEIGVHDEGLIIGSRPTTAKLRVVGGHQQMMRLDFEDTRPITSMTEKQLRQYIDMIVRSGVNCIIISDYAKGLCTPRICQYIINEANKVRIPVIVDPKGHNWGKYSEAFLLTPNLKELGEAVRKTLPNTNKAVKTAAEKVRKKCRLAGIMVTRSEKGMSLLDDIREVHIPTRAQEVFDVSGAGDTVIAVLGAALAGGINVTDAAQLSNLAAGVVVAKIGTYAVSRKELSEAVTNNLEKGSCES